jgi:hypothetical protein
MTNDIKPDDSNAPPAITKPRTDDVVADPVAVVLMLQQEAGNRQQENNRLSAPLKQAAIKEKVLRRMLENSLESAAPAPGKKPDLKIVK